MRRKIHFLLFLFLCMASIPLAAQDIEVKGVVTEATTNEPLPGVTVRVKEEFYKLKYCSTVVYMVPRA